MATINIPKEALPSLKALMEMDEARFNLLLSALSETSPSITPDRFTRKVSEKVKEIPQDELLPILKTAFVLYVMKEKSPTSSENLAESVSKSAVAINSTLFPPEKREPLSKRLKLLLSFDKSFAVTAKAVGVLTDHEHIFCRARILSDIRPVFTDTLDSAAAAVIVHNLQIGYHHNGQHQEFYIALDTDDIQKLKEVIARAEKKTIALQSLLNKANTPYLEV